MYMVYSIDFCFVSICIFRFRFRFLFWRRKKRKTLFPVSFLCVVRGGHAPGRDGQRPAVTPAPPFPISSRLTVSHNMHYRIVQIAIWAGNGRETGTSIIKVLCLITYIFIGISSQTSSRLSCNLLSPLSLQLGC